MALVVGVAFLSVLLLATVVATYVVSRRAEVDETGRAEQAILSRTARDARTMAEHLEQQLSMLSAVAAHPQWRAAPRDDASRAALTAAIRQVWPRSGDIIRIDDRGRVVSAGGSLSLGDDTSGRRWFDAAPRGPLIDDEGSIARVVVPLVEERGRTVGVLSIEVQCDELGARLRPAADSERTREETPWVLLGRQGEPLCRHSGFDTALLAALPVSGALSTSDSSMHPSLVAVQRLGGAPVVQSSGWRMVSAQSLVAAVPQARNRMSRLVATVALVSLFALPLVWLFAQRLARPMRQLTAALNQAREQFEYDPRRIPVGGALESRILGQSVRAMLRQIAAQQALVDDSAASYRELFEMHPLPMWVVDDETLRFLEVNHAARRKYGWRRDEFLAMSLPEVVPPDSRAALLAAHADARGQEHHSSSWQHRLRSDETVDVEIASRELLWGGRAARLSAVMDVTARRKASLELRGQRRDLSELARQLMSTEETERRRLAQVLHDHFTPTLYGIKLSLEALRTRLADKGSADDLRAEISRVAVPLVDALDGAISDTRNLMSDLRPPLLAEQGLAAALQHEAGRQRREDGPVITLEHHGASTPALDQRDLALEYAAFMVAQAALNNALQHSGARQVSIDLVESPGRLLLSVRDDGRGFDSEASPPVGHLGLTGMRERAQWIGAELSIASVPGMGTTVSLRWPAQILTQ